MRSLTTSLTGRLSRGRRSRWAGPMVLLVGLLMTGGLYALFAPAGAVGRADSADQAAKGRQLFQVGCASCHGLNGQGTPTQRGGQYGPPLAGVGAAAVDFQVGTGRMPMAQPGQQVLAKKQLYSPEEIRQLAAYVASLGPGPAIPEKQQYDISGATTEQIANGGSFFRTNCTACHNFAGSGGAMPQGKFAPNLTKTTPRHIFEAMLTGPQQMPSFSGHDIPAADKRDIIAYIKKNDATPSYGGFSLGSLGPVSEGMFAWLVGVGGLVAAAIWIASHTTRSQKRKV